MACPTTTPSVKRHARHITPCHAMQPKLSWFAKICKAHFVLSFFLSFSVPNTWSGCFNRNTPGSDSRGVSPHVSGSMIKSAPILPSIIWKNLKSSKSLNYTRCDMHNTRDLHLTKWNTVQYSMETDTLTTGKHAAGAWQCWPVPAAPSSPFASRWRRNSTSAHTAGCWKMLGSMLEGRC